MKRDAGGDGHLVGRAAESTGRRPARAAPVFGCAPAAYPYYVARHVRPDHAPQCGPRRPPPHRARSRRGGHGDRLPGRTTSDTGERSHSRSNRNDYPTWTPNGAAVTFTSDRAGPSFDPLTKRADGSGEPVLEIDEEWAIDEAGWRAVHPDLSGVRADAFPSPATTRPKPLQRSGQGEEIEPLTSSVVSKASRNAGFEPDLREVG
jgi:hypothetical protein